jgi:hypothetical protein
LDCEVARKSLQRNAYVRYLAEEDDGDDDDHVKEREERRWLRKF